MTKKRKGWNNSKILRSTAQYYMIQYFKKRLIKSGKKVRLMLIK